MKKLFALPVLVLCAFLVLGATVIVKISSFPNTTTAANGDLFLLASGSTNKNISWAQLKQQIGTNPPTVTIVNVSITTNAFISYLTNINQYVTNQFVTTNYTFYSIVTNLNVINQTNVNLYSTNNYFQFITNQTLISQFIISTNNYFENITNSFLNVTNIFNVSGKATLNVVNTLATTATNGFYVMTNAFGGPSNTVDLSITDQGYGSFTPCSVTGVINKSNTVSESVIMTFTNKASTNWLLTLAGGIVIPEQTNQVPVTNGRIGMLSMRYHPAFGTNAVWRNF